MLKAHALQELQLTPSLLQQPGPKKFKLSRIELISKAKSLKFPRSLSKLLPLTMLVVVPPFALVPRRCWRGAHAWRAKAALAFVKGKSTFLNA